MTDQPPAPSDQELRDILDMLGTVVASVSDRVDAQTEVLARVNKTATEARQAAFAARAQTDPKKYGDLVGEAIEGRIKENLTKLAAQIVDMRYAADAMTEALNKVEGDKWEVLRQVRDREEKADRLKHRVPWLGLGAVVLAIAMTLLLPQFLASNGSGCAVIGGQWTRTTTGGDACVFYVD